MIEQLKPDSWRLARRASRTAFPFLVLGWVVVLGGCRVLANDASDTNFRNRTYVGAGALVSHLDPDTRGVAGASVDDSMGSGGSLTVGHDVNDRVSVEGHLASLGDATIDPAGTVGYTVGGVSGLYYGLNEARNRARREGFAVFGRLGLGGMDNDASGVKFRRVNDVHLLAGVGLEYGLSSGVGLRAEFVAHETDAKYAQLGVLYRLGTSSQQNSRAVVSPPGPYAPVPESSIPKAPVTKAPGQGSTEPEATKSEESALEEPALEDNAPFVGPTIEEIPADPLTSPALITEFPAAKSTPVSRQDTDGDKVPDLEDQCPDTLTGTPVKEDGCPIFGGVVEGINFRTGSDTLTAEAINVLAGIAETLREYSDIRVVIEAHTDNQGAAPDNLQLSKRRAIAVARYLVDAGISGSRLKPQAYGESKPRAANLTAQGRAANRRVEISILQ